MLRPCRGYLLPSAVRVSRIASARVRAADGDTADIEVKSVAGGLRAQCRAAAGRRRFLGDYFTKRPPTCDPAHHPPQPTPSAWQAGWSSRPRFVAPLAVDLETGSGSLLGRMGRSSW